MTSSPLLAHLDWGALETRRLELQKAFDAGRTKAQRNRLGQFPTPPTLAHGITRVLASFLKGEQPVHFADPTFGSGAFLSAALGVLGEERLLSAQGIEFDADLLGLTRELWHDAPLRLFEGDFCDAKVRENAVRCVAAPNFVLANPPYVRHHHLSVEDKTRLRALVARETGHKVSGLTGLYIYCLLLSLSWMAPEGVAAWLIPAEWLDVNYGEALKIALLADVELLRIHRFDPKGAQFDEALVSSTVIFFRNRRSVSKEHTIEFSTGDNIEAPLTRRLLPASVLRAQERWSGLFCAPASTSTTSTEPDQETFRLGDMFSIRRGLATGANEFFILSRAEARRRGLPSNFLRPILPSPKSLRQAVIAQGDDGYPSLDDPLCLLDCSLSLSEVERDHPALWSYLQEGCAQGFNERYLATTRSPWYRQEKRDPAPFLCTYMGRGGASSGAPLRFLWNRSQSVASNLYLMLYPRAPLASWLGEDVERFEQVFGWLQDLEQAALTDGGRVYGGGLHKIEPKELGNVPLRVPQELFETRTAQLEMNWK